MNCLPLDKAPGVIDATYLKCASVPTKRCSGAVSYTHLTLPTKA